eukprot:TRINITY_DN79068_c0_g1_i2.p3 TRINITY_DN79068_c0_g1~~TRINITY_DN79068_c0_g1_i2.p3  ORF type:complete len:104 (-),score=5.87 TRINITY_DN79068_c0_g1_i2:160-471(-)
MRSWNEIAYTGLPREWETQPRKSVAMPRGSGLAACLSLSLASHGQPDGETCSCKDQDRARALHGALADRERNPRDRHDRCSDTRPSVEISKSAAVRALQLVGP